jgi:hypothetical protein
MGRVLRGVACLRKSAVEQAIPGTPEQHGAQEERGWFN